MRKPSRFERGFTLVEIVVATAMMGIIGLGAMRLFVNALGVQHKTATEFDLRQAATEVVGEIGRGFQSGGESYPGVYGATDVEVFSSDHRIVLGADEVTVAYQWDAVSQTLTRSVEGGDAGVLLSGVEKFDVACVGPTEDHLNMISLEMVLIAEGSPQPRVPLKYSLRPRVAELECH